MDTLQAKAQSPRLLRRLEDLPGPRGRPLLGNLLQIEPARFHQQMEQWAQEWGPYFKLSMGRRRLLAISKHEDVATVLRNRPEGFRRTPKLEQIWRELGMPGGVFGAEGDVWARQRRMVMSGFDPAHVKHYLPAMQKVAGRLAGRWRKAAQAGAAIDLQADLMRYTVDTIAGLAFGAEVNTLESKEDVIQKHLDKILPSVFKRLLAPLPVWRWRRSRQDRELEASILEVKAAVAGFIAEARARMQTDPSLREQPRNLLEAMIAAADIADSGIDDAQVAGNVVTMLLAGEDTTANTLAWMIDLLWRHPGALARAKAEVNRFVGTSTAITIEQLAQLDFVEACAHETMRLKPVAPLLSFQALHDVTIGDVAVPRGTIVFCVMRKDSVSDAHFAEAPSFIPERWLAGEGASNSAAAAPKRVAMPFGAGPRVCPGRYLALMEIKLAIATLLSQFEIESVSAPGGAEAKEKLAFTMSPQGLTLKLSSVHSPAP